jgi:hypothetical protein
LSAGRRGQGTCEQERQDESQHHAPNRGTTKRVLDP